MPYCVNIMGNLEPEPIYSLIGADKYKDLCKEFNIVPFSRIIHCLDTETLNLKVKNSHLF